jgi:hypothetical protein
MLRPMSSSGALLGFAQTEIHAPAARVWAALTDFARYGEWNPFTPELSAELRVDAPVRIVADMGFRRFVERGRVVAVEPERLLRWHVFPMPRWLAWGDRVQTLEPLGPDRCLYRSEDRLRGALAPLVALMMRRSVTRGFVAAGQGLKRYVEAQLQPSAVPDIATSST